MCDRIKIQDLKVSAWVGITEEERQTPQSLELSLELWVPGIGLAAQRDDLRATVDYVAVCEQVKVLVQERPRKLLETLAEEIAAMVLKQFAVKEVHLEIKKFILPDVRWVSVCLHRSGTLL